MNVTDETKLILDGLIPHGVYTINITAKSLNSKLESEVVSLVHEMKQDGMYKQWVFPFQDVLDRRCKGQRLDCSTQH